MNARSLTSSASLKPGFSPAPFGELILTGSWVERFTASAVQPGNEVLL